MMFIKSFNPAKKVFRKIFDGDIAEVFRGMAILFMGSGTAKLIGITTIPITTRLYGPENFGILAIFTVLTLTLAPLMTLRYSVAIPLPKGDRMAMNLLALALATQLIFTITLIPLLWLYAEPLLSLISMEGLASWWWLIIIACFGNGLYEILSHWATRKKDYKIIAKTSVRQQLTGDGLKILLGLLSLGTLGLLIGQAAEKSSGSMKMFMCFRSEFYQKINYIRFSRVLAAGIKYIQFPIYRVPSQFLLVFSQQAPLLFAAYAYGADITGQLSLAFMALTLPVSLIGSSISRSLFSEAASIGLSQPERLHKLARAVQVRLIIISVAPAVIIYFLGEQIFTLFFGAEWKLAGQFSSTLSLYLLFQFSSSPLMQLLNLLPNQTLFFNINLLRTLLVITTCGIALLFNLSAQYYIASYSILMAIFYLAISIVALKSVEPK